MGKRQNGSDAVFRDIPNGIPGFAARLPIIFSEGVSKGRITLDDFVRLTSTNAMVAELVKNWATPAGAVAFPLLT